MKRIALLTIALLSAGQVYAATDHYVLSDGNYVRHLKISKIKDDYAVSAEVDYENSSSGAAEHCSADISGPGKSVSATEISVKKHSEIDATFCELKIQLSPTGAKIEQGNDCSSFALGKCGFSTDGKELLKTK